MRDCALIKTQYVFTDKLEVTMLAQLPAHWSLTLLAQTGSGLLLPPSLTQLCRITSADGEARILNCSVTGLTPRLRRQLMGGNFCRLRLSVRRGRARAPDTLFEGDICYLLAARISAAESSVSFQATEDFYHYKPGSQRWAPAVADNSTVAGEMIDRCLP